MVRSSLRALALVSCLLAVGCGKKAEEGAGAGAGAAGAAPSASAAAEVKGKEAASAEVTLQIKAPAVGAKRKVEESNEMTMQLKMGPKDLSIVEKETVRRVEEVLAVTGNLVTKMKVTYEENSKESTEGTKTKKKPDTLAGKTFIVEAVQGKVNVTTGEGKPVMGPAKLTLLKEFKQFGQQDKVEAALPKRPLKIGEELPELGAALGEQLKASMDDDGRSGTTVDPPKVTLKRKEGDLAVFGMTAVARSTKGMMKGLVVTTNGEIFVRIADGQTTKMTADGTMGLTPEEQAKSKGVTLTGTLKRLMTATPQ